MDELVDIVQLHHETVELPEELGPGELEISNMVSWEALHHSHGIRNLAGAGGPCLDQVSVENA